MSGSIARLKKSAKDGIMAAPARVAQPAEREAYTFVVPGSSPGSRTNKNRFAVF